MPQQEHPEPTSVPLSEAEEPDIIWERMLVGRPAGTHLSATGRDGDSNGLVRDDGTNALRTHAVLRPLDYADEDSSIDYDGVAADLPPRGPSEFQQLAVAAAVTIAKELAPHAKRLWVERALPAIESARSNRAAPADQRRISAVRRTP